MELCLISLLMSKIRQNIMTVPGLSFKQFLSELKLQSFPAFYLGGTKMYFLDGNVTRNMNMELFKASYSLICSWLLTLFSTKVEQKHLYGNKKLLSGILGSYWLKLGAPANRSPVFLIIIFYFHIGAFALEPIGAQYSKSHGI